MAGYWEKRQLETYKAGEMKVNQYFTKLEKAFNQTRRELQKTVESFYFRYAEENGLSYAAAQVRLDNEELGELQDFINLSVKNIGKHSQIVNNLSIKARITRYQALEAQVDATLRKLYTVDYQDGAEKMMQEVYEESYHQTWYNIDQYRGFHAAFAQVDTTAVEELLKYPFNGANFSSRLWKQKDHLQAQLMESITTMMVQGKNPQVLAADFAKKMNAKKFDAYRLLHTESSFLMSEATHAGYQADGVEKYQILATLDSKTCGICGDKDGDIHEVDKAVVGDNMPPFHCFCRCTDVPYYDDMDLMDMSRVARDPETGGTYEVPADMTYPEWKRQYAKQSEGLYEGDMRDKIKGIFTKSDPELESIQEELKEGIQNSPYENVKNALLKSLNRVKLKRWNKPNSRYDGLKKVVMVGSSADDRTIAHELFHEMDDKMGLSKGRALLDTLETDSELLIKRAVGYGNDIESMIQSLYPDEFEITELGNKVIKEEHRGLSDILHGLSYGEIDMGYGHHKPGYWDTPLNVEREAWAQIGRSLYQNNPKDLGMLKDLLPDTYEKVLNILKEVDS